jgi:hypothetical protein
MRACVVLAVLAALCCAVNSAKNPKDCEGIFLLLCAWFNCAVCIKVLDQIAALAGPDIDNQEVVEAKIMQFCKEAKGKEHRFVSS